MERNFLLGLEQWRTWYFSLSFSIIRKLNEDGENSGLLQRKLLASLQLARSRYTESNAPTSSTKSFDIGRRLFQSYNWNFQFHALKAALPPPSGYRMIAQWFESQVKNQIFFLLNISIITPRTKCSQVQK